MITIIITNTGTAPTMTGGPDAGGWRSGDRRLPMRAPALSPPPAPQDGYEWVRVGGRWVPVEDIRTLSS